MIDYRNYTINTRDFNGWWAIYKNNSFVTLATQQSAINWIDLEIDYFNSRHSV